MGEEEMLEQGPHPPSISIEILPPNRGLGLNNIHNFFTGLDGWKPTFVSVTYHQAHKIDIKNEDGEKMKVWNRKKPGTLGVCAMLKFQYGLKVIPHLICGGFSKFESEDFLVDLDYLGLDHVLALRGDPKKGNEQFNPHPEGNAYASELVEQISSMNKGIYLEEVKEATPTNFTIGVAGYPEKHREAFSIDEDILNLKRKVDAGASFIITQMFFDNSCFFDFQKKCHDAGINVPIIPGLKILTSKKQVEVLPKLFYTKIPNDLINKIMKCETNEEVKQVGINYTIKQAKELVERGVENLHFFTMNDLKTFSTVLKALCR
jgi:methylenetetrahydrofolate reductase (NADPH)